MKPILQTIVEMVSNRSEIEFLISIRDRNEIKIIFNNSIHFWFGNNEIQIYRIDISNKVRDFAKFESTDEAWVKHLKGILI
jgi:hypothetical protein